MSHYYVASAKKATAVQHAVSASLTGPEALQLVIGKTTRIEILTVSAEGLKPLAEIPIYGKIATLDVFRPKGEDVDSLIILTTKYDLAIVSWDSEKGELRTRASGNVADRVGRPSETGIISCVHNSGIMVFRLYDGSVKVIEWEEGKDLKAFAIRLEENNVYDMAFLATLRPGDVPRLCYIYEDTLGRHLKTVELMMNDRDLRHIHKQSSIESEASWVVAVPCPAGGCIVVGGETIVYTREDNTYCSASPPNIDRCPFTSIAPVDNDGSRFLLGDLEGNLFMLILDINHEKGLVKEIKLELLGETSIADCLVYLDNGVVFVGSRLGDSQLVLLSPHSTAANSYISVLETFTNIGPIRDMTVIESDGLSHIVTCSGGFKESSLRIIRNGIGIEECASVDLAGVKGLFPLRLDDSPWDNYLVVSLSHETHILRMAGEDLEDIQLAGLETEEATLWCGTVDRVVVQVTPSCMRLARDDEEAVVWRPPPSFAPLSLVSVASRHGQILVGSGAHLFYFEIKSNQFVLVKEVEMNEEVSCVNINPLVDDEPSDLAVVGLWKENSAVLLSLPSLEEVHREKLASETVARAMQLLCMEGINRLLVATGDGSLFYFIVDLASRSLRDGKKARVGTQPTALHLFHSRGSVNVLACSDRPVVLYSSAGKLVFSNVNLKLVTEMCPLNSETYSNSLVLSDGETLVIGRMDDIQKLHIRSVPLGEHVARIAHQPSTSSVAILTARSEKTRRDSCSRMAAVSSSSRPATTDGVISKDGEIHYLCILDEITFEILHSHELRTNEQALSLLSCKMGEDSSTYFVVGTGFTLPDETEPKTGRIIVFEWHRSDGRSDLRVVHEKEAKGAVYSIATLGTKLVVAINSCVRLFEWSNDRELKLECSHFNYTAALEVKTKGDLLLVSDLMRSLCLLNYKPMESALEEVARDQHGQWMTASEIVDGDTFLGAEASANLFSTTKDVHTVGGDDKQTLTETGAFYLGDTVNIFRRGSLVSSACAETLAISWSNPLVFGTSQGALGVVISLPSDLFKFLLEVEGAVAKQTSNCMRCEHGEFRSFHTPSRTAPKTGFIDGDLVEGLLEMPRETALRIVSEVKAHGAGDKELTAEEILKVVEELSRLH